MSTVQFCIRYITPHSLQPQEMEEHWSLRQNSQAQNSLIQKSRVKRQFHNPLLKKSTHYSNNKRHSSFTLQANFQSDTQLSVINHSLKSIQTNLSLTIHSFISLDTSQPHAAYFLKATHQCHNSFRRQNPPHSLQDSMYHSHSSGEVNRPPSLMTLTPVLKSRPVTLITQKLT